MIREWTRIFWADGLWADGLRGTGAGGPGATSWWALGTDALGAGETPVLRHIGGDASDTIGGVGEGEVLRLALLAQDDRWEGSGRMGSAAG